MTNENKTTETVSSQNSWLTVTRQIALCVLTVGGVYMIHFMANKVNGK